MMSALRSFAYDHYKTIETQEHKLQYLFLEITRKCNLSCRHCGSDCSSESTMKELSTKQWLSIIDQISARYNPFFVLTGGEPLMHPDFSLITEHLKKRGAHWGMVTNGMALTKERLEEALSKNLQSITLSLDGTPESHLYLRRHPKSWEKAVGALEIITASSIAMADVVTCVFPQNLHHLNETAELLLEKGVAHWRLFRIFPKGAAAQAPELILSFEESQKLVEWIAQNRKVYAQKGLDISFSCEGYLPFSLDRKVRKEPFFCRAGINIASVLADGSITGCNNNGPHFYQGSILETSFEEIWEERFVEYRNHQWKKRGICAHCKEWSHCLGGSIHLRERDRENPLFCYCTDQK